MNKRHLIQFVAGVIGAVPLYVLSFAPVVEHTVHKHYGDTWVSSKESDVTAAFLPKIYRFYRPIFWVCTKNAAAGFLMDKYLGFWFDATTGPK
jgi:hypothetical protein